MLYDPPRAPACQSGCSTSVRCPYCSSRPYDIAVWISTDPRLGSPLAWRVRRLPFFRAYLPCADVVAGAETKHSRLLHPSSEFPKSNLWQSRRSWSSLAFTSTTCSGLGEPPWRRVVANLLLIQNLKDQKDLMGTFCSLPLEVDMYLSLPVFCLRAKRDLDLGNTGNFEDRLSL